MAANSQRAQEAARTSYTASRHILQQNSLKLPAPVFLKMFSPQNIPAQRPICRSLVSFPKHRPALIWGLSGVISDQNKLRNSGQMMGEKYTILLLYPGSINIEQEPCSHREIYKLISRLAGEAHRWKRESSCASAWILA